MINARRKGKNTELEIANAVKGQRIGYLHKSKADVVTGTESDGNAYQVKADKGISWPALVKELDDLTKDGIRPRNFLAVKKVRGRWLIIETLEQHIKNV